MTFVSDPHFWYMLTFFTFLALFARQFMDKVTVELDHRAHEIENQLREMTDMRKDAIDLLSVQKRQKGRMEDSIKKLQKELEAETNSVLEVLKAEHQSKLRLRSESCEKRLDTIERRMADNIQAFITHVTLSTTKKYIHTMGQEGQQKILNRRVEHFVKLG